MLRKGAIGVTVFASDMDGTFLDSTGRFDVPLVQGLLTQMQERGDHLVVASSNHYDHLQRLFADVTGPISYVCDNGAHVVNEHGQTIYQALLPVTTWQPIAAWIEQHYDRAAVIAVTPTKTYSNLPANHPRLIAARYFYADLQAVNLAAVTEPVYKLDVTWPEADVSGYHEVIQNQFAGQIEAVMSGMSGIDVMAPGVSKLTGLQHLLVDWNVELDQVVAFGDNDNDYALLEAAGSGWVMKNAAPNLLARISQVTDADNDHNGVATIIQKLMQ